MIVTGWKNGKQGIKGVAYGLRVNVIARDKYLERDWVYVILSLQGYEKEVTANIDKDSFWSGKCQELIKKDNKIWMQNNDLIPWPFGSPPKFEMKHIGGNRFAVTLVANHEDC